MARPAKIEGLTLYQSLLCPFCVKTRKALKSLNMKVAMKEVGLSGKIRQELVRGGGKAQVPCLRIERKGEPTKWLYESNDIIRYLRSLKNQ
ncbi:glutathione S-transferase N-terminal domain-containing protein [uncultured Pseudoteredinibacter sp.]|uniref:glutaredoxin family protein n=1 Tax=uncultured Pseudoteredinibacter sp. TaxID=1641701 RepID=UPI00260795D5|nr:glutathione S-transferase N-terminal domain-containing protein [uncultured Pseudoteredinibacter sp.]